EEFETLSIRPYNAVYLLADIDAETLANPDHYLERTHINQLMEIIKAGGGFYIEGVTPRAVPAQKLTGFIRTPGLPSVGILKVVAGQEQPTGHWILEPFHEDAMWQVKRTGYLSGKVSSSADHVILDLAPAAGTDRVYSWSEGERFPVLIQPAIVQGRGFYSALPLTRFREKGFPPQEAWERLVERVLLAPFPDKIRDELLEEKLAFRIWTEPRRWSPSGEIEIHVKGDFDSLEINGLPDNKAQWQRPSEDIATMQVRLSPGEYRIQVQGRRGSRSVTRETSVTIEPRREWYRSALDRTMQWFRESGLLLEPDGSRGILEGFDSINLNLQDWIRTDCTAQAGLTFYLYGRLVGEPEWEEKGENLLQFLMREGYQDMDQTRPTFGFWKWGEDLTEHPSVIYTEDNSWAAYAMLRMYQLTGKADYLNRGLATVNGFLETQTPSGLRLRRMEGDLLLKNGRDWYAKHGQPSIDPHYVSNGDIAVLLAYEITGDQKYLDSARRSIDALIEVFPNFETRTALTRATQYVRFVSSPALLYRYTGEDRYLEVMNEVLGEIRKRQVRNGAIPEWGTFRPENFGDEGPVITREGEPISDQLYTTNFAMLNLQLICSVLGTQEACDSFQGLADYLSRIQLESTDRKTNGAWNRAFDLKRWEPFGNNSDPYWGPYAIESGWTNTLISIALMDYLEERNPFSESP
ncbi:MAG TPA: hypothetical protein VKZ59_00675, partial [Acidobacteriota bacterium]|nr:hypothetical protein [Acidobacteriota bacterium]